VPIADVASVVVTHRHHDVRTRQLVQESPALLELASIALSREITGDHHQVRAQLVRLRNCRAQQVGAEQRSPDMQIRHLDDPHAEHPNSR